MLSARQSRQSFHDSCVRAVCKGGAAPTDPSPVSLTPSAVKRETLQVNRTHNSHSQADAEAEQFHATVVPRLSDRFSLKAAVEKQEEKEPRGACRPNHKTRKPEPPNVEPQPFKLKRSCIQQTAPRDSWSLQECRSDEKEVGHYDTRFGGGRRCSRRAFAAHRTRQEHGEGVEDHTIAQAAALNEAMRRKSRLHEATGEEFKPSEVLTSAMAVQTSEEQQDGPSGAGDAVSSASALATRSASKTHNVVCNTLL